MDEFALIRRWFGAIGKADGVVLGVGDDAALLRVPDGELLVAAADTLVAGVHFPDGESPAAIGYRAVAVNASDIAAMAATPRWLTLALTLPEADADWLDGFASGLAEAAADNEVALVGGDTTRGPLTISVQMLGSAPSSRVRRRSGGRPGDLLLVSGTLGDAAGGLGLLMTGAPAATPDARTLIDRFRRPPPRWRMARDAAHDLDAAIDVSDGLLADLAHLADASGLAATIDVAALPLSPPLVATVGHDRALRLALGGGDDYELLVAARPAAESRLTAAGFTAIGRLSAGSGVRLAGDGADALGDVTGYRHFRGDDDTR